MVSRAERNPVADWWFTVDKLLLIAFLALIFGGIVLSLAASPAVAERIGIADSYYFVKRQAMFAFPAIVTLIGVSFLNPKQIRRAALAGFVVCVMLLVLTLLIGPEVKGSRRWITILGMSVQPSEFMKPMFAVLVGFLLAEGQKRPDLPGRSFSMLLLGIVAALFVAQPDFGQTMLICLTWGGLFFISGMSWMWIVAFAGAGATGILSAYTLVPHVRSRIERFMNPEAGDTFQVQTAQEAFINGGWWGQGPGEGTFKRILPDSHTDFVFAVLGEEFGLVLCMCLALVFAFVVLRGMSHAMRENDGYVRLATTGLIMLFGLQSCINMAVNLHLMPAKGMTLPFISYGGSSLVAVALSMGMLLALTRKRPDQTRFVAPIEFSPLPGRG
ncbi:FtsW/RodA/SpoVE family cell cycle protein [Pleomorphomonas sp. JP5]|uniref:FtsW/RodA/SpoVE family cell cycle protein n=1 Tax=Pleomorphomonas sp. JP5 TaxID=2942998 RepID=UPI002043AFCC|nr:putative peptidoglycan glycosyltransferase FtsW [Pleomorphomonas sp. JP5]MCM5556954.1 putative lipid II flippase FtsW [Pleomorphomonas sp. JP5]